MNSLLSMDSAPSVLPAFSPARNTKGSLPLSSYRHILCRSKAGKCLSARKCLASTQIRCEKRESSGMDMDRRRLLLSSTLGLSALTAGKVMAEPFPAPDLSSCVYPTDLPDGATLDSSGTCCPPYVSGTTAVDFVFPSESSPMRTRKAAHLLGNDDIAKYDAALKAMKALDASDPRSFAQQAKVHCAYCNGSYLVGSASQDYQVHKCWIFAPFHRWYIYFYERILGSLIGDDTFALPFWNWDTEEGMSIPPPFTDTSLALYNKNRDSCHQPPVIINLSEPTSCDTGSVKTNYSEIYTHMVSNATTAALFHGGEYRYASGQTPETSRTGTLESTPHNLVHAWTGSSANTNREEMGSLYSAGRDPLFYSHHSNVDRMWSIWNEKLGRTNYTDTDLTKSKFLFYDENKQLVQVNAGDCYDITKLRYQYQDRPLPWLDGGRKIKKAGTLRPKPAFTRFKEPDDQRKPLTGSVSVLVKRPSKTRTKKQVAEEEEVLSIEGLEFDGAETSKFSIFINYPEADSSTSFDNPHYAGSFVNFGHGMKATKATSMKESFKVGISETLEDLGADGDESVVVTLVPQGTKFLPKTPIKFTSVKIEYLTK